VEKGQITHLLKSFPTPNFQWKIQTSSGVASLNSPVLVIRSQVGEIDVCLAQDLGGPVVKMPYLRFHLCVEDAHELVALSPSPLISTEIDELNKFISLVSAIKAQYPDLKIAERRKHALLGQWVIGKYPSIQIGPICFLVDNTFDWSQVLKVASDLDKLGEQALQNYGSEFDDLEDEDHDEDDPSTRKYDFIDE
jgi:hypothetical protein